MMASVHDLVSKIRGEEPSFARRLFLRERRIPLHRRVGDSSLDLAKRLGLSSADLAKKLGLSSADLAKRVGGGSADVARRVGPVKGLLGIALLGGAVAGGVYLVRYLRQRAEEADVEGDEPRRSGKLSPRARSRAANAYAATH